MNESLDRSDGNGASPHAVAALDGAIQPARATIQPTLAAGSADRAMLVVQYALAVIAVVSAILLSRVS